MPCSKRTEVQPFPSDLDYLQAELHWIEARCRRIGLAAAAKNGAEGEAPRRRRGYRDEEEHDPSELLRRSKAHGREEARLRAEIDARLAKNRAAGPALALDTMCEAYGLGAIERNTLLLALTPAFGSAAGAGICALRSDFSPPFNSVVSVDDIFTFHEFDFADRVRHRKLFSLESPLMQSDLISRDFARRSAAPEDLLESQVVINARTFAHLVGQPGLHAELVEFSSLEAPLATLDQVVIAEEDKRRILSVVQNHEAYLAARKKCGFDEVIRYGRGVLLLFHGAPGTGKTMTAHGVAHAVGRRVLNVDIPTFLQTGNSAQFLPALFREARLQDALLFFDECESLLGARSRGNELMNVLLTEIERFEGIAVLATNSPEALDPALERRILMRLRFAEPDRAARLAIWKKHLPPEAPLAPDVDLDALASQFEMTGGYIKNAVLTAVAEAVHDGSASPSITHAHLERAARQQLRRIDRPDKSLFRPAVGLADVHLPDALGDKVREIVCAVRDRRTVLERWGLGKKLSYGTGITALFWGPPGTGKTHCAEAIAGELNRPLLVASFASLRSMWVGQTEKNIEALFADARGHDAVLFIDECDALLTARGESHGNRHDDIAIDVLLVQIERFEGVVILASNLAERLDKALARRVAYNLHFPAPDAGARARIWQGFLVPELPVEGEIDVAALAQRHRLTGGQIKNAVMRAAYRAARAKLPLSQAIFDEAAAEESGAGPQARPVGFGAAAAK
ncbi:MAG: AAA family ATPase [Deltaproteobacteria bacterium]|nr:AAA family ATPase [Deltaproteobacteria bacterium]